MQLQKRSASGASTTGPLGVVIRDSNEADMAAVQRTYAHHVLHGLASFEEVPPTVDDLMARRAAVLAASLPHLVAEHDGEVVGYSYATGFRPRSGYRHTIEDSVYVAERVVGKRVGSTLLEALIARCEAGPWRQMVAVIGDSGNTASIALHHRFGFRHVGTFGSIGLKLGRWVDVVLMQRPLGVGDQTLPTDIRSHA